MLRPRSGPDAPAGPGPRGRGGGRSTSALRARRWFPQGRLPDAGHQHGGHPPPHRPGQAASGDHALIGAEFLQAARAIQPRYEAMVSERLRRDKVTGQNLLEMTRGLQSAIVNYATKLVGHRGRGRPRNGGGRPRRAPADRQLPRRQPPRDARERGRARGARRGRSSLPRLPSSCSHQPPSRIHPVRRTFRKLARLDETSSATSHDLVRLDETSPGTSHELVRLDETRSGPSGRCRSGFPGRFLACRA